MSAHSGLDFVLTEEELADVVAPLVAGTASTIKHVLYPLRWMEKVDRWDGPLADHDGRDDSAPCLLQHSSGTTGLQKPVVLSHRAVLQHVRLYSQAIGLTGEDKVVSWLPLYHDMGLIAAFYLPLVQGVPLVQLDTMEWVCAPALLLTAITDERATLCWLPNFAYNFMADRIREEEIQGLRLDSIRMLVNCAEPVRAESHDKFHRRFAAVGLSREALTACYAMAETTFAVTQTPAGREARTLNVDRAELSRGNVITLSPGDGGRVCVSSGPPISGCTVRIVDESRREVPAGKVGEIAISSVSLFDGYRNYPEKTAEVMHDGWYYSGDYGFMHDGECFVIGRRKDVIIIAGNNVFPEDVEDAVGRILGVIPGRVAAFGVEDDEIGTEVLCVLAETEATDAEKKVLRKAVKAAGIDIDVTISRVYLVPPRWLIKRLIGQAGPSCQQGPRDHGPFLEVGWLLAMRRLASSILRVLPGEDMAATEPRQF
jgi:acyl-CoA synthetase (AMP-forming)/AMP-acid ligase II